MISRTTTRAGALVATLLCLVVGGLAAVAPTASAQGEVTVVWPEITAFNPDVHRYDVRNFIVEVEYDVFE